MTTTTSRSGSVDALIAAVHAEWIKLRTVRSTWWALACSATLMVVVSAVVAMSVAASAANGYDVSRSAARAAVGGVLPAQLPLVALAALTVTGEYAGGAIGATLCGIPLRGRMLLAKTLVAAGLSGAAGLVLAVLGSAVAAAFLGGHGAFIPSEVSRAAIGAAGYLVLLSVLVVGAGTALRSTAGALLGVLVLLLAVPTVLEVSGVAWLIDMRDYLPSTAGDALMSGPPQPYGAWAALLVLAVWAMVAQLVGYAVLWHRDA